MGRTDKHGDRRNAVLSLSRPLGVQRAPRCAAHDPPERSGLIRKCVASRVRQMRAKLGPLVVGASVFLGIVYWDYWLLVRGIYNSYLPRQYERIIDGSAPAPDQYRPLVPKMAQLFSHAMSLENAIGAVEIG